MLKKVLSTTLAASMLLTPTTAFALSSSEFEGTYVELDMSNDDYELDAGTTYDIPLVCSVGGDDEEDMDDDFDDDFRVTFKETDGKSYASVSLHEDDGDYYARIKTNSFSSKRDRDYAFEIEVRDRDRSSNRWTSDEYKFTILSDANNVDYTVDRDDDYLDIPEGETSIIECEETIRDLEIDIDGYALVYARAREDDLLKFHMVYDDVDDDVYYDAPDNATLTFFNFKEAPTFSQSVKVGLVADNDERYVYEIGSNGKLTSISAREDDGYLFFNTKHPAYYVISDRRLSASGSSGSSSSGSSSSGSSSSGSSSSGSSTSKPSTGTSTGSNAPSSYSIISKSTLQNLFANTPAYGTAVLNINANSAVYLSDLKAVSNTYPGKSLCVVYRQNGTTKYQYRLTGAQIRSMSGAASNGTIKLGMTMKESAASKVFNTYFKNKTYVVSHNNHQATGVNGAFVVDLYGTGLSYSNLVVYQYNRAQNQYQRLSVTPTVDKYGFAYFTAPVGPDLVISNGALTRK